MTTTTRDQDPNHNTLPVYVQVSELLVREIAAGRLMDGERLSPEREMAQAYDISVGTLRKALAILVDKGLLRRVQGSGNYVDASGLRDSVYAMFRLELPTGAGLPRARVLSVDTRDKPVDLPPFGTTQSGTRIRRLRFLDAVQIAVEEIWLDSGAGVLDAQTVSDSLYRTYQQELALWIARAEDRVGVGMVPDWTPPEFSLKPGSVAGFIERFSWSDVPAPVEYSRTWFDPARAVYVQRIK